MVTHANIEYFKCVWANKNVYLCGWFFNFSFHTHTRSYELDSISFFDLILLNTRKFIGCIQSTEDKKCVKKVKVAILKSQNEFWCPFVVSNSNYGIKMIFVRRRWHTVKLTLCCVMNVDPKKSLSFRTEWTFFSKFWN